MQPGFDASALAAPTALIFALTTWAAWRVTRSPAATLGLAFVKTGIYWAYYAWSFDGTYTFLDDWTYLERGAALQAEGVGWLNMIDSLPLLLAAGEGNHFLYYLFNASAIGWFGEGYYAPVALNVMLSVIVAWSGTRLVVAEGLCAPRHGAVFFAFLILHPDIVAWSTVMNGKDIVVLLLHVVLLTSVSLHLRGGRRLAWTLALIGCTALLFLRFYVPLLFAAALGISALMRTSWASRLQLAGLSAALVGMFAWLQGAEGLGYVIDVLRSDLINPLVGFVHFTLTPVPFGTDREYGFLDVPALLHWLMLPAAALGLWSVASARTPFSRYLVAYTFVFVALYAVFGELQGPRHRVQLDFAWAVLQFIGLRLVFTLAPIAKPHARAIAHDTRANGVAPT
jgi:hypothetical protein